MSFEIFKTKRAPGDVVFIVGTIFYPHVGNSFRHGRISAGPGSYPFITQNHGRIITEGVNEDLLLPQFPQPQTPDSRFLTAIDTVRGIGVIPPVYYQVGILQGVLQQVIWLRYAQSPVEAVGMCCPPVPALPAIGIIQDICETD